jgi:hypothetical protein
MGRGFGVGSLCSEAANVEVAEDHGVESHSEQPIRAW